MKRFSFVLLTVALAGVTPAVHALQTEDVIDLVAMPLAVAAVSEVSGVSSGDLIQLVTALNDTRVAPAPFVEIVRYSPVLLVDPVGGPELATFVMNEVDRGMTDEQLILALRDRIRATGIEEIEATDRSNVIRDRRVVLPETVVRRVDEIRNHPHGGPPGQIKKEVGVQTGAEIVHGTERGRQNRATGNASDGRVRPETGEKSKAGGRDSGPPPHAAAKADRAEKPNNAKGKAKGKDKDRGDR